MLKVLRFCQLNTFHHLLHQHYYQNDRTQVGFIGTLLSSTTLAWFTPLLEQQSPLLNHFEAFIGDFGASFSDSNKECTTTSKLRTFHQESHPISMYASKFRQLICDISWDKAVFMSQFSFRLRGDVKDLLLTMLDPTTLNQVIAQGVRFDNRLFECRQDKHWEL